VESRSTASHGGQSQHAATPRFLSAFPRLASPPQFRCTRRAASFGRVFVSSTHRTTFNPTRRTVKRLCLGRDYMPGTPNQLCTVASHYKLLLELVRGGREMFDSIKQIVAGFAPRPQVPRPPTTSLRPRARVCDKVCSRGITNRVIAVVLFVEFCVV
ncbi:hypothetical protein LSAT2_029269, partial [Lamellibrachia satsuma]